MTILFSLVILIQSQQNQKLEISVKSITEIKDNCCFINPLKPSGIDLTIKNRPKSFQNSVTVKTGLPDFHKIMLQ